jgi:hypothetical protein
VTAPDASDLDRRIQRALGELGTEHDPPAGGEARVFAAIAEQRIGEQLAQSGEDLVPPPGWEDRVLAATRRAQRRRTWWLAMPAFAAAAAVVLWIARPPPVPVPPEVAFHATPKGSSTRSGPYAVGGKEANVGDEIEFRVQIHAPYVELWIYHGGDRPIRCPGAPVCSKSGGEIVATIPSAALPDYIAHAIASNHPVAAPSGDADRDLAIAGRAGGVVSEPQRIKIH